MPNAALVAGPLLLNADLVRCRPVPRLTRPAMRASRALSCLLLRVNSRPSPAPATRSVAVADAHLRPTRVRSGLRPPPVLTHPAAMPLAPNRQSLGLLAAPQVWPNSRPSRAQTMPRGEVAAAPRLQTRDPQRPAPLARPAAQARGKRRRRLPHTTATARRGRRLPNSGASSRPSRAPAIRSAGLAAGECCAVTTPGNNLPGHWASGR